MSHGGLLLEEKPDLPADGPAWLSSVDAAMRILNRAVLFAGGLALVAASLVLTHSVVVRYILKSATDWQDEHAAGMFDLSAELAAEVCRRWQIPIVHLTPDQLLAGQRGIIGHVDATEAYQVQGGHQDPGKDWPWDNWLSLVLARVPPASNS